MDNTGVDMDEADVAGYIIETGDVRNIGELIDGLQQFPRHWRVYIYDIDAQSWKRAKALNLTDSSVQLGASSHSLHELECEILEREIAKYWNE